MTCNPNCHEITGNLLPGQITANRPDLCTRVFDIKNVFRFGLYKNNGNELT